MKNKRENVIKERRFECQRCGFCCSEMTLIYPSLEDIRNIAKYLNISEAIFAINYLQEIHDPYTNTYAIVFKTKYSDMSNGCIFCQDKLCIIYNSQRTALCKMFPWNHFNIEKGGWEENFVSNNGTFWCPGIGKGRMWSLEKISNIKKKCKDLNKRIIYHDVLHNR